MEKIKVLLVEDEPTLAMIIKDTLDGNEFDITLAANGEEGLSRYAEIKPDIIVADIMMPKMDGFTMVKLIRKTDTHTPVLFLSARSATSFRIGLYTFDSITQTLVYRGEKQLLSNRESEILKRLCDNKDQVLPMKGILIDLWGDDSFFNARSLHVFITKLRHKLSKDESIKILNIRGIGYKLIID